MIAASPDALTSGGSLKCWRGMTRKLAAIPGITFALVFAWKVAMLIFTTQPIPANDSFFYDGAIVNYLLHDRYVNPSIVLALPISGNEVYSAYPPLYHITLLCWMKIFGTSALSQMWLHVLLFGLFELVLLAILGRLRVSGNCINLAGLFLFGITFQDRPDSLAHVLGMASVYATVRSRRALVDDATVTWSWIAAILVVLTLCTGLQIGGFYFALHALLTLGTTIYAKEKIPVLPLLATVVIPAALITLVKFGYPRLWAGFAEHAQLTPTFTGLRVPVATDVLKVVRSVPGVLASGVVLVWLIWQRRILPRHLVLVSGAATIMAVAVVVACLSLFTPNLVAIAGYPQPLIVGGVLAMLVARGGGNVLPRYAKVVSLGLALLVSIRAIGMTTWGVLCARETSYSRATRMVSDEVSTVREGGTVVVSSAYLYDVACSDKVRWIHSDWPSRPDAHNPNWERDALLALKPEKLLLTQFDYHRRYKSVLAGLQGHPEILEVRLVNDVQLQPPDASPALQKVVQHISWSPVVVTLAWRSQL